MKTEPVSPQKLSAKKGPTSASSLGSDPNASSANLRQSSFFRLESVNRFMSSWRVDLEREKEGYTAGRCKTYCGILSAWVTICVLTVLFVICFCRIDSSLFGDSVIGYGDVILTALIETGGDSQSLSGVEVSLGLALAAIMLVVWVSVYVLDIENWSGRCLGPLGVLCLVGALFLTFVTALFWTNQFPAAPFMAFLGLALLSVAGIKHYLFSDVQKLFYLRALTASVFVCGLLVLFIFIYFTVVDEKYWDFETKIEFYNALECPQNSGDPTFVELLANEALLKDFEVNGSLISCDEAFLVWVSPLIYFGGCLVFAGVLFFLTRAEKQRMESNEPVKLEPMAQVFVLAMSLSLLGLWVAASIASATAALSSTILSLSFQALIIIIIVTIAIFGVKYLKSQVMKTPIGEKFFDFLQSDWGKGLAVLLFTPIWVIFLVVDYIKQLVRRKTIFGKNISDPEEMKLWLTKPVHEAKTAIAQWNFGSVIPKALIWGMFYFTFSVGVTRVTVVFLSYLREVLLTYSFTTTTFILIVVGLIMFLLPPVPGVPVYITCGIILPFQAEDQGVMSFGLGLVFSILISLAMKLVALVLQQKAIGEMCGARSVSIRYTVGINSVEMRALRKVLSRKGWSFGKVVILVGGPDWPTSVLTGIMRLNVFEMLLGTVPVVVLIAPCVISGTMLVKAAEETDSSFFASVNTVAVFLTVVIQAAAMLAAVQVIASASVRYEEELKLEEPDREVLELEKRIKSKLEAYREATNWKNLGGFWKIMHVVNLVLMMISCYAFQLFSSNLFVAFEITDSIATTLDGNALNLVTETGWGFLLIFTLPTLYYFIFKNAHTRREIKEILEEKNEEQQAEAAEVEAAKSVSTEKKEVKKEIKSLKESTKRDTMETTL